MIVKEIEPIVLLGWCQTTKEATFGPIWFNNKGRLFVKVQFWPPSLYLKPGGLQASVRVEVDNQDTQQEKRLRYEVAFLVGDTGLEPVTSTMSR